MRPEEQLPANFGAAFSMQAEPGRLIAEIPDGYSEFAPRQEAPIQVGLLTGGNDRPYALGLALALAAQQIALDFIGSDALDAPELHNTSLIRFMNLRGDQCEQASFLRKLVRILNYYRRLIWYAAASRPSTFHILWNNKFELIDRVALMFYYKLLGKKVVLTAHNVNAAKRDGKDNLLNRLSLKIQYRLSDHIFVHTGKMKAELRNEFNVRERKITVIPFGINNTIPTSTMTTLEAKRRLGLSAGEKTALFFGQIAPYKGLEYLIAAMAELGKRDRAPRLVIAGRIKPGHSRYWDQIRGDIVSLGMKERVIERIEFVPDDQVELYFKAADVVVIPYVNIFQSGVPFLAYSFGLPVIATDVGSLREDVVEGKTGFLCQARDSTHLAESIEEYFDSELYQQLATRRREIQDFANETYSWTKAGEMTRSVYTRLLAKR